MKILAILSLGVIGAIALAIALLYAFGRSSFYLSLANTYLEDGKIDKAIAYLEKAVAIDPNEALAVAKLQAAKGRRALSDLQQLSKETATRESDDSPDLKEEAVRCADVTERATSYSSQLVIRDLTREDLEPRAYVHIKWEFQHESPDRYSVRQVAGSSGELDAWITIGQEHYRSVGLWGRFPEARDDDLNQFLLVNKFLEVLREAVPTVVEGS